MKVPWAPIISSFPFPRGVTQHWSLPRRRCIKGRSWTRESTQTSNPRITKESTKQQISSTSLKSALLAIQPQITQLLAALRKNLPSSSPRTIIKFENQKEKSQNAQTYFSRFKVDTEESERLLKGPKERRWQSATKTEHSSSKNSQVHQSRC